MSDDDDFGDFEAISAPEPVATLGSEPHAAVEAGDRVQPRLPAPHGGVLDAADAALAHTSSTLGNHADADDADEFGEFDAAKPSHRDSDDFGAFDGAAAAHNSAPAGVISLDPLPTVHAVNADTDDFGDFGDAVPVAPAPAHTHTDEDDDFGAFGGAVPPPAPVEQTNDEDEYGAFGGAITVPTAPSSAVASAASPSVDVLTHTEPAMSAHTQEPDDDFGAFDGASTAPSMPSVVSAVVPVPAPVEAVQSRVCVSGDADAEGGHVLPPLAPAEIDEADDDFGAFDTAAAVSSAAVPAALVPSPSPSDTHGHEGARDASDAAIERNEPVIAVGPPPVPDAAQGDDDFGDFGGSTPVAPPVTVIDETAAPPHVGANVTHDDDDFGVFDGAAALSPAVDTTAPPPAPIETVADAGSTAPQPSIVPPVDSGSIVPPVDSASVHMAVSAAVSEGEDDFGAFDGITDTVMPPPAPVEVDDDGDDFGAFGGAPRSPPAASAGSSVDASAPVPVESSADGDDFSAFEPAAPAPSVPVVPTVTAAVPPPHASKVSADDDDDFGGLGEAASFPDAVDDAKSLATAPTSLTQQSPPDPSGTLTTVTGIESPAQSSITLEYSESEVRIVPWMASGKRDASAAWLPFVVAVAGPACGEIVSQVIAANKAMPVRLSERHCMATVRKDDGSISRVPALAQLHASDAVPPPSPFVDTSSAIAAALQALRDQPKAALPITHVAPTHPAFAESKPKDIAENALPRPVLVASNGGRRRRSLIDAAAVPARRTEPSKPAPAATIKPSKPIVSTASLGGKDLDMLAALGSKPEESSKCAEPAVSAPATTSNTAAAPARPPTTSAPLTMSLSAFTQTASTSSTTSGAPTTRPVTTSAAKPASTASTTTVTSARPAPSASSSAAAPTSSALSSDEVQAIAASVAAGILSKIPPLAIVMDADLGLLPLP